MSNSPRRANPRKRSSPDYLIRTTNAMGRVWWHVHFDAKGQPIGADDPRHASKFRGAGLASAVRALRRRGYVVERVPC